MAAAFDAAEGFAPAVFDFVKFAFGTAVDGRDGFGGGVGAATLGEVPFDGGFGIDFCAGVSAGPDPLAIPPREPELADASPAVPLGLLGDLGTHLGPGCRRTPRPDDLPEDLSALPRPLPLPLSFDFWPFPDFLPLPP